MAAAASNEPTPELPPVVVETVELDAAIAELEPVPPAPAPVVEPHVSSSSPAVEPARELWLQACRAAQVVAIIEPVAAASTPAAQVPPPVATQPPAVPSAYVEATQVADNVPPEYPANERRLGHEGTVVLLVRIGADGTVQGAELAAPCPFPGLNRAALRAVEAWRFEPAQRDGARVASELHVPIVFQLTMPKSV